MEAIQLSIARRVVPELLEVLQERTRILNRIALLQPIGRRALAAELGTTERILRAEVDFLKQQGLLMAQAAGMSLSVEGQSLLEELNQVLAVLDGRSELSSILSRKLGIPHVIVVNGDSDEEDWVKNTLGLEAAQYLRSALRPDDVLAVTGGSTMAAVASRMPHTGTNLPVKVVPARGGLGENVAFQANTVASLLAEQLGGTSVMLHVPDRLSEETLQMIVKEPLVQERLQEIRQATVVVHGIGEATRMAERRRSTPEEIAVLHARGAVAEAFGYYFDAEGRIIYEMNVVGLRIGDLSQIRAVVGVAGGHSKAEAIAAAAKAYKMTGLITDEGAARQLIRHEDK